MSRDDSKLPSDLLAALEQASQVAPLSKPVLVIGERGTGKELIARAIHAVGRGAPSHRRGRDGRERAPG